MYVTTAKPNFLAGYRNNEALNTSVPADGKCARNNEQLETSRVLAAVSELDSLVHLVGYKVTICSFRNLQQKREKLFRKKEGKPSGEKASKFVFQQKYCAIFYSSTSNSLI